jgi:hypothetical protein
MSLDARDRSSIYNKLVPVLGERDANALMSQFPGSEADELVTRQFLRAELAELRAELHGEVASVRSELANLRTEMVERFRLQTVWLVGVVFAGMGLAAAIAKMFG